MCRVVSVKSAVLFPVIEELLANNSTVRIMVTGNSMLPFLREKLDSVELQRMRFDDLEKGRIVLIRRDSGAYVLHRVIKKTADSFYIIGDNQQWIEGPLRPDQLLAGVVALWRRNRRFQANSKLLRMAGRLWLSLLPVRHIIKAVLKYPWRLFCRFQKRM